MFNSTNLEINHLFECNLRIYGHVLGGARIKSSDLEGVPPEYSLSHFIKLLKAHEGVVATAIIRNLEQCELLARDLHQVDDVSRISLEVAEKVKRLTPGETILLPGGWKGDPYGHFMLYEISRTRADLFRLRIIDTGGCSKLFFTSVEDNRKRYQLPCATYEGIPERDLLYGENDAAFFNFFLGLCVNQPSDSFDPICIYQGWLKPLECYRNDQELVARGDCWITPQRAGTCSWNALKAYLRVYLTKEEYKTILLDIETKTLLELFESSKRLQQDSHPESEVILQNHLSLLKIGIESVSHYLQAINRQRIIISDGQKKECEQLLLEINLFLEELPEKKQKERTYHRAIIKENCCSINEFVPERPRPQKDRMGVLKLVKLELYNRVRAPLSIEETREIARRLAAAVKYGESYRRGFQPQDNLLEGWLYVVEEFTYQITFESLSCLPVIDHKDLKTIYDCYLSARETTALSSRQVNTALVLYLLIWRECCRKENIVHHAFDDPEDVEKLIERLVPPENLFESLDGNPFFLIYNERDLQRMLYLRGKLASSKTSHSLDPLKIIFNSKEITSDDSDDELFFLKSIAKSLKSSIKTRWACKYKGTINQEYEQQAILSLYQEGEWRAFFPKFSTLASFHFRLASCLFDRVNKDQPRFYEKIKEVIILKQKDRVSRKHGGYLPAILGEFSIRYKSTT